MKKQKEVRVCDKCGQQVSENVLDRPFGGSSFGGWVHVEITGGSTRLEELQKQKIFDFCCKGCLRDWLNGEY